MSNSQNNLVELCARSLKDVRALKAGYGYIVEPELGPNCCIQRLSAHNTSKQGVKSRRSFRKGELAIQTL